MVISCVRVAYLESVALIVMLLVCSAVPEYRECDNEMVDDSVAVFVEVAVPFDFERESDAENEGDALRDDDFVKDTLAEREATCDVDVDDDNVKDGDVDDVCESVTDEERDAVFVVDAKTVALSEIETLGLLGKVGLPIERVVETVADLASCEAVTVELPIADKLSLSDKLRVGDINNVSVNEPDAEVDHVNESGCEVVMEEEGEVDGVLLRGVDCDTVNVGE